MTLSVQQDRNGPDWPVGLIVVATPGTPVGLMSLVDPSSVNAPNAPTSTTSDEYSFTAQQIQIQALKAGASHGLQPNTGNIYVMRKPAGAGSGTRDDYGSCVAMLFPGQTLAITAAPMNMDVLSPYRYYIDADNAGDSALVTLFIG